MERNDILTKLSQYKLTHRENYGIEQIGIFGSFANDSANDQSDIDVYIKLKHASLFLISRIRLDLEKILKKPVDIVQLRDKMNPYLKRHIEQESISA